jgi:hypothetical protein
VLKGTIAFPALQAAENVQTVLRLKSMPNFSSVASFRSALKRETLLLNEDIIEGVATVLILFEINPLCKPQVIQAGVYNLFQGWMIATKSRDKWVEAAHRVWSELFYKARDVLGIREDDPEASFMAEIAFWAGVGEARRDFAM